MTGANIKVCAPDDKYQGCTSLMMVVIGRKLRRSEVSCYCIMILIRATVEINPVSAPELIQHASRLWNDFQLIRFSKESS